MADFSDRERLDWLSRECSETDIWIAHDGVEREAGNFYRVTVDDGEKIYHGGSTRQCLDAAMLASGLVPQERESVSMEELRAVFLKAASGSTWLADDSIRAVLAAATGSDGRVKRVEEH
jgi:hypothetical protein